MIERLITIGFINSTGFIRRLLPYWNNSYIVSTTLSEIVKWCEEYYQKYQRAPGRTIEDIYFDKKEKKLIPHDLIESLEEDLEDLSSEYDETFNVKYAIDEAKTYINDRHLHIHLDQVRKLREDGKIDEATDLMSSYKSPILELENSLDLGKEDSLDRIEEAFNTQFDPLIEYPGALGEMINDKLVRGGFVALQSPEKRGKSFWLLDMAIRAVRKNSKVAFFQAGDMTEAQQLLRICSYLEKKPIKEKNTGDYYEPVADCIRNQLGECDKEERTCDFGSLEGDYTMENIKKELDREVLIEAFLDYGDDYTPCTACQEYKHKSLGSVWFEKKTVEEAIDFETAKKVVSRFFIEKKRNFKISTHPNNTLSVFEIRSILRVWSQDNGFVPDVIVIDYADLLVAKTKEFRHAQNEIWKDLRALSQELDCLVLTATQSDARSYDQDILKLKNYSEDKRKYAHVTAMFGLNQDRYGREKKLGITRINELVVREGGFDITATVTVLQNLNLSRAFLDSYL